MARRGRPRKAGKRDKNDRLIRETGKFTAPADHVTAKRKLWSFVTPAKGPDGRGGEIDQDICDGIGQLHALGLLNGHGFEATDLRDIGRTWRDGFVMLFRGAGFKIAAYERKDKGHQEARYTARDEAFDRMDDGLTGFERSALMSLLVDPIVGSWPDGEEDAPWVRSIIAEGLLARKRLPAFARMPDGNDRALFEAAIRGLCQLMDASLKPRWVRAA
jgi:hypothetical protein